MRLPDFVGIGAPKCATTWLFESLRQHPQVFMPERKEVNYLHYGDAEDRFAEYVAHFAAAAPSQKVGEFSTRYLQSEAAVARARKLLPKARFIVSLRNPADQVWSHYWHLRRQNFHQRRATQRPPDFEQAVAAYPELLIRPAQYSIGLTRWLDAFAHERFLIVHQEDVRIRPEAVLRDLFEFIGVEDAAPVAAPQSSAARAGTSPKSALHEAVHRQVYAKLANGPYRWLKTALGVGRAEALKERLHVRQLFERLFANPGYPAMTPAQRRLAWQHIGNEPDALERLLNRDYTDWQHDRAKGQAVA